MRRNTCFGIKKIAEELTNKTKGMLIGKIKQTVSSGSNFQLDFYVKAPALNNSILVFDVFHDLGLYPLTIVNPLEQVYYGTELRSREYEVEKSDNFENALKQIFLSHANKRVVNGLLAQIKSA
ncbi:hypothetical protein [Methylovulum miyakonense]|uniref:hypothetical protein n=1 Tax=Methylovulum miyakonense TaxID=645578 RepID=UPI00058F3CB1|nr:hypothetical protein [Methylovulum miyakonense]